MRGTALPLLFAVALGACTFKSARPEAASAPVREPLRARPSPVALESTPPVADEPEPAKIPVTEPAINKPPLIRIEDVVGTSPATAGVMFAPVTESVERCTSDGGGFLRVHVSTAGEQTRMVIDPQSRVAAATTECVLEALSLFDEGALREQAVSPSDAPPRMETQLTITWR